MNKLLHTAFIVGSLIVGKIYGLENDQPPSTKLQVNNIDCKNIMAQVKNIVILRSFEGSFWDSDINYRKCYLEAYDIETGDLVWCHHDVGIIVSFIIINEEKIIYRNYNHLTAINLSDGVVIWSKKTKGEYSTIVGQ